MAQTANTIENHRRALGVEYANRAVDHALKAESILAAGANSSPFAISRAHVQAQLATAFATLALVMKDV